MKKYLEQIKQKNQPKGSCHTDSQQSSVCPANKLTQYKEVKHRTHIRFKGLYQHQWSCGEIQTVDHREAR